MNASASLKTSARSWYSDGREERSGGGAAVALPERPRASEGAWARMVNWTVSFCRMMVAKAAAETREMGGGTLGTDDSGGGEGGTSVTQEDDQMDVDGDDQIRRSVNPDAKWKPFASEMDWRVAKWFIHEDIGQNALDRFLSIPGVS